MLFRFLILATAIASSPASAKSLRLCSALGNLKDEVKTSGTQRVTVFKEAEMTFACARRQLVKAQVEFCDAAGAAVGVEFTHAFPWLIYDCLRSERLHPGLEKVNQYTGLKRKKLNHLWARWSDGTRIDIRFRPAGDYGPTPELKDYWGAYNLVIWRPE